MGEFDWLIMGAGVFLVILSLVDAFLTVLYSDSDGPVIRNSFHGIWRFIIGLTRTFPSSRRTLISLAGPLLIVTAVLIWVGMFVLGFTLIYWPNMDQFALDGSLGPGFIEAFYFSGTTATVLGYGDITPENRILQVVSVLQAGLGFGLMTGIITYLINVVSGMSDRNALALRLWALTGRTGDGADAFVRLISSESPATIRLRLQLVHDEMYKIHQKMYQFPILDLFYRSQHPVYSPELMLRSAMQIAIAARIVSADDNFRELRIIGIELADVTRDIMRQILDEHLGKAVVEEHERAEPDRQDRERLERFVSKLEDALPGLKVASARRDEQILRSILRMRLFMDQMDEFTGWRMDDLPG